MVSYLIISLRWQDGSGVEALVQVKLLNHTRDIANNFDTEHGAGETTAVREEGDALGLAGIEGDVAEQAGKTSIHGGRVHVTTEGGNIKTGTHPLSESFLGQTHEGLLHSLVGERFLVIQVTQFRGYFGKGRVAGVGEVVIVEHAAIGLLHQFAGRRVEQDIVKAIKGSLGLIILNSVGAILNLGLKHLFTSGIGLVASINSLGIALEREMAINDGVFASKVGLEEIISVGDVTATETRLEHNRGIRSDQHGNGTSTTSGAGSPLGIEGNVSADNNGISAIPGRRLNPVDAVEHSVGTTIASIDGVNTLNVGVSMRGKQLHQHRLDRLGFVKKGLCADLKTADRLGVDVVFAKEGGAGGQSNGVDVWGGEKLTFRAYEDQGSGTIIPSRSSQKLILVWPRPIVYFPSLTPSNFSNSAWSTHWTCHQPCCELEMLDRTRFKGSRPTYLTGEVDLNGLDTNVLGTSRHGGGGSAN